MFLITRNGKTIVVTGWRAWLAGAIVGIVAALVLVPVAFVVLGLTITLAAVLLFAVPLALLIALIMAAFGGPRDR